MLEQEECEKNTIAHSILSVTIQKVLGSLWLLMLLIVTKRLNCSAEDMMQQQNRREE